MKTNCIKCGKQLDNWDVAYPEGASQVHPLGGTVFRSYGNYGSTVFDPLDASYLDICVCDSCLSTTTHVYAGVNESYKQEQAEARQDLEEFAYNTLEEAN